MHWWSWLKDLGGILGRAQVRERSSNIDCGRETSEMKKRKGSCGIRESSSKERTACGWVVLASSCRQHAFSVSADTTIVCLIMQGLELGKGPHRHRHDIHLLIKRREVEENGNKDHINKKKKNHLLVRSREWYIYCLLSILQTNIQMILKCYLLYFA